MLVAHGNVIGAFVASALGVPAETFLRTPTVNCGISAVVVPPDGVPILLRFNDSGHLPQAFITG